MENLNQEDSFEGRIYEVGYILVPTISEEEVSVNHSNMKDLVSSLGGAVISDETPKMIDLAYSMVKVVSNVRNKFNTGYFGWVKFNMSPDKVLELKSKLDLDVNIIRFLTIKTVKENTVSSKKFTYKETPYKKASTPKQEVKTEGEEPVEINNEEIDKEIDAMVSAE